MATCTITATEFKAKFDRGPWTYGATLPDVRDKDIDEAIAEAEAVFNCDLYPDEATCKLALSYLTAHYLQTDLDAADTGGQAIHNVVSRSADGISESVQIPEEFTTGIFAQYSTTRYGQKYIELSLPYLKGAVYVVEGGTTY